MIKDKTLYDLQNIVRKLRSEGNPIDDIRRFTFQLIFCFYCEACGVFFGKPFSQIILHTRTELLSAELMKFLRYLPPVLESPERIFLSEDIHSALKRLCALSWKEINPSLFGAIHQSIMDSVDQRSTGTHYTSLENVHRVIDNLLLDQLLDEYADNYDNAEQLKQLNERICRIKILDPACGGGNYLIETYLSLSALESEIFMRTGVLTQTLKLQQFTGIELSEDAAKICRTALFTSGRMAEIRFAEQFGTPLSPVDMCNTGNIICADALSYDWNKINADYIVGNPPFMFNHKEQSLIQSAVFADETAAAVDYSAGWLIKSAKYMSEHKHTECALLTVNSVCQGRQVRYIWKPITEKYKMHINWAYQSFRWVSDISNAKIDISCVITAFSAIDHFPKQIISITDDENEKRRTVNHINAYLTDYDDIYLYPNGINDTRPPMILGNRTETEILSKLESEHKAAEGNSICRYVTADNMLSTLIRQYVVSDKGYNNSIVIPRHSSEKRKYIPMLYLPGVQILVNGSVHIIPNGNLFLFGMLTSSMHNAWVKLFCGRLDMRIRYSNTLCYNNFPFPEHISNIQQAHIAKAAQCILSIREKYSSITLGKLYNDLPPDLLLAHITLDQAVEELYSEQLFINDDQRIRVLIELYNKQNDEQSL